MMMRTTTMPTLQELRQLLHVAETRLAVFGDKDPGKRAQLEDRCTQLRQEIRERGGEAPRLPYGDDE
jgi:hypothetical protein